MNSIEDNPQEFEKVESLKADFLNFISHSEITSETLVTAWGKFIAFKDSKVVALGLETPVINYNLHRLLESLSQRSYIDPITAFIAVLPFELEVSFERESGIGFRSILLELPYEDISPARDFCQEMIEVGQDPRKLDMMII